MKRGIGRLFYTAFRIGIGDVPFVTRSVPVSPKCAVGEFPYMAYDNLGSDGRYLGSKNSDEDRGGTDMTDNVKKELELHVRELQHSIDNIVSYADTTKDVVKMNFESIRLLVDYCEELSLEGESAMARWRREKFKEK